LAVGPIVGPVWRGLVMNFAKVVESLEKKAAVNLSLGALSLSLLTGCSPTAEQRLDQVSPQSDGIARSFEPQLRQPSTTMSYLDVCKNLSETSRRCSTLLDEKKVLRGEPLTQFCDTLRRSYEALLKAELDPSLSQRDKDTIAALRPDVYQTLRTAAAERLTSWRSGDGYDSNVDGNSEMLYRLIAQLDTAVMRLDPKTPPAAK
jgi:hypothetical protein